MLKTLYPKLIHVTCFAHGFHRIAEEIRDEFSEVDAFISNMKKAFLKCPQRIQIFREVAPNLPIAPAPVLTRWGTWLQAVEYYVANFSQIKRVRIKYCVRYSQLKNANSNLIHISVYFTGY